MFNRLIRYIWFGCLLACLFVCVVLVRLCVWMLCYVCCVSDIRKFASDLSWAEIVLGKLLVLYCIEKKYFLGPGFNGLKIVFGSIFLVHIRNEVTDQNSKFHFGEAPRDVHIIKID